MPHDDEIARLRAMWDLQESDAAARRAAQQREKLEMRRDDLQAGQWKPSSCTCDQCLRAVLESCTCDQCLRAVLELTAPAGLCEKAQRGDRWW
jgi:hypothetical protein